MKRIYMVFFALFLCLAGQAVEQETVGAYTWYYFLLEYYDSDLQTQVKRAAITSWNGCAVFPKPGGAITVPSTLGGYAVTRIGSSAFSECAGLSEVTIPSSVETIYSCAFKSCPALTNVILSAGLKTLENQSFYNCDALTKIELPDTVESIGSDCFMDCSSLTSVTLGSGIKIVNNGAFSGCSNLSSVKLPAALKTISSYAFRNCGNLKTLNIPATVTAIAVDAFFNCAKLAFTVASDNAKFLSKDGSLYNKEGTELLRGSGAASTINVPAGVTQIGSCAFYGCTSLKAITFPASVMSIGIDAFVGCTSLMGVEIPSQIKTIEQYTFYNCTSLASVTIPSGVTSIGNYAFYNCDALATVEIPSSVVSIGYDAFCDCDGLMEIVLPEGVKTVGYGAFDSCGKVKRVVIPASVTSIGNGAFGSVYPDKVILYGKVWPAGISCDANKIYVTEENGAYWQKEKGEGVNYFREDDVTVTVLSAAPLATDASKLEVKYRVASTETTVNVRALAFIDGTESFANVVRPETFVKGSQIGDGVQANVVRTFVWDVKNDWEVDLATVKVKVYAMRPGSALVPLELMTIPANGTNRAMQVSWNAVTDADLLSALFWLYADKTAGFKVEDGILKNDATELVNGSYINRGTAAAYIFGKMGYQVLTDALLPYVREMTEKELKTTNPYRSYAFKYLD